MWILVWILVHINAVELRLFAGEQIPVIKEPGEISRDAGMTLKTSHCLSGQALVPESALRLAIRA
jgi:hypothetical protein